MLLIILLSRLQFSFFFNSAVYRSASKSCVEKKNSVGGECLFTFLGWNSGNNYGLELTVLISGHNWRRQLHSLGDAAYVAL